MAKAKNILKYSPSTHAEITATRHPRVSRVNRPLAQPSDDPGGEHLTIPLGRTEPALMEEPRHLRQPSFLPGS
jgi:hypothetical protein